MYNGHLSTHLFSSFVTKKPRKFERFMFSRSALSSSSPRSINIINYSFSYSRSFTNLANLIQFNASLSWYKEKQGIQGTFPTLNIVKEGLHDSKTEDERPRDERWMFKDCENSLYWGIILIILRACTVYSVHLGLYSVHCTPFFHLTFRP